MLTFLNILLVFYILIYRIDLITLLILGLFHSYGPSLPIRHIDTRLYGAPSFRNCNASFILFLLQNSL